jgi:HAD superfamily hydrolase (TIGR01549 family)
MSEKQIAAVLLDAGGVILDETEHEAVRAEITVSILSEVIPSYTLKDYHADIEEAVSCFAPKVYRYIFWKHLKPDIAEYERLYKVYTGLFEQHRLAYLIVDGIVDEIRALSGFKIGLAGMYGHLILDLLNEHGILDCFSNRLTQDDFAITKPDPRYLEQIAHSLDVEPKRCVMVGDRIDNDIVPARMLGMKTVLIRTGLHKNQQPRTPAEFPDIELTSVHGLADAVRKLTANS